MNKATRWLITGFLRLLSATSVFAAEDVSRFDVVIVGGTPGRITSAIAAARGGHTAVILDRNRHLGGLPANGLGATDIATRRLKNCSPILRDRHEP